jgi:hypothetical protein
MDGDAPNAVPINQQSPVGGTARYVPDGYDTPEEYLEFARKEYEQDAAYDRENREQALEDLKFVAGHQWDDAVRAAREKAGRPVLTINVLPQFIGQVIGDRRLNKTAIKVRPRKDATQDMADTRSGIIKSIESYSRAERVYDSACEDQVTCGISNFRIDLDYADNDVFEQDIFIRHIPNPLAVVWDRMAVDPTGRDAGHCFVQDSIPRNVYDSMYPKYPCPGEMGDGLSKLSGLGWFDQDVVRVMEHWRMIDKVRTLALMMDGTTQDVTDKDPAEYEPNLWLDATGKPRMRRAPRTYAQMHLITGFAILEPAYEIALTRLPIIRVEGRVVRVGESRVRYGLVRFAKDSQRLKNYWRSVAAETIALAPKAQWIARESAVKGREQDFREGHLSGDPLLIVNDAAQEMPVRVQPATVPAALLQEAVMNQQDIKDTTGLQDASLGVRSNEISGRAIQARQREGDVATVIYHDNLNNAIQEGGDVVNQLIPVAYDTVRTLRVIGQDEKHAIVKVNDPQDPESPDITSGKYDISLETGPSFTTQRQEAAAAMLQAIQVAPELMNIAGDLIVKAQDWPGAYEISERLKKAVPPQMLPDNDPSNQQPPSPEQQQAAEAQQQLLGLKLHDEIDALEKGAALRDLEVKQKEADIRLTVAQGDEAEANAQRAISDAHVAHVDAEMAPLKHTQEMDHAERVTSAKVQQMKAPKPTPAPSNRDAGPRPAADRNGKPAAAPRPKGK